MAERKPITIVVDDNGCEICISHCGIAGYPTIVRDRKQQRMHRFIYENWKGLILKRNIIHHICQNRACINILHLELLSSRSKHVKGERHGSAILSEQDVREIRADIGHTVKWLADKYGVCQREICLIKTNERWRE